MIAVQNYPRNRKARVSTEQMARDPDPLPPVADPRKLALELRLTPRHLKDDALQEAWLAYLDRREPARAVNTFVVREKRHAKRTTQLWTEEDRRNAD